ncbi:MAG: UDP-glucose--hexose-1-phosphate uridylyltransferase [Firmicutes bacterium]|nr:UDP-glucose--hexose-1-phosphate uridylyltransferase [Bacillota bacterium]
MNINLKVCELIYYAKVHLDLKCDDELFVYNALSSLLKINDPKLMDIDKNFIESLKVPDEIINPIGDYAVQNNLCENLLKANFECAVMGIVTNPPSEVIAKFNKLYKESVQSACNYLYTLSMKNNYIHYTAIQKNLYWKADFEENYIEVTVNLSKPEKDNKEIAKIKSMPQGGYPLCVLCLENVGFSGDYNKAARQTLRTVPLTLNNEEWFMQYSPYLYYDEHCIIINKKHVPMNVNEGTFKKLFDFVDLFPHYFVGSNASLPIVGGSILNHEHFQGGLHLLPMHFSKNRVVFKIKNAEISILDWYNSVVRIVSDDKKQILKTAEKIFSAWGSYSNEKAGILAKTDVRHNAITPILLKNKDRYVLDIILRNNRTSKEHPDGIFHAHKQYHGIKKEGIGLIEAMGLFILPGRLKEEMEIIADYLTGAHKYDEEELQQNVHQDAIKTLLRKYPVPQQKADADKIVKRYVSEVCKNILECTAVFKNTKDGQQAFVEFLSFAKIIN